MFSLTDLDDCGCVSGPSGTCSRCKLSEYENSYKDETNLTSELYKPDYDVSSRYCQTMPLHSSIKTKVIKAKWIEVSTDKAVLVLSKTDEWFWIPLELIQKTKKTSKGNWKFTVTHHFKMKSIKVDNHHYFNREDYVKCKS